jgi:hypothetical protein
VPVKDSGLHGHGSQNLEVASRQLPHPENRYFEPLLQPDRQHHAPRPANILERLEVPRGCSVRRSFLTTWRQTDYPAFHSASGGADPAEHKDAARSE